MIDPSRLDARLSIGQLYVAARDYDKAEEAAKVILEKDPKNTAAYQLLGTAYIGKQQSEPPMRPSQRLSN